MGADEATVIEDPYGGAADGAVVAECSKPPSQSAARLT